MPLVIVLAASLLGILPSAALLQVLGGQKTASGKRLYAFRETFKVALVCTTESRFADCLKQNDFTFGSDRAQRRPRCRSEDFR